MNNALKINFEHNQLKEAAYFIQYCADHNVECSTLNNDGIRYTVEVPCADLANLSRYLVADAPKYVEALNFLARINESMLLALNQSADV